MKNKNNDSNFSTNFNTKPKLLLLKKQNYQQQSLNNPILQNNNNNDLNQNKNLSYEEQMKKIYEERIKIQNRIKKLDDEEKNVSKNNTGNDPGPYLQNLFEEYFKNILLNNKDNEKTRQKILEDNEKFQNKLMEDFLIFKNRQKVYLEKLQDKYYVINRKKDNLNCLDEKAELISEPLYQGENVKNIFAQLPQQKYNLVINSAGDTKNELINDINSKFYKNKLCQGVIQCMAGESGQPNFIAPEKKFLEVNNVKMDRNLYIEGKNEFDLKRNKEKLEKECEEKIINNQEKTVNLENKLFDIKYNNYLKEIKELENNKTDNFQILRDIKAQMTKDKLFGKLTHKQLNIFKKSNEEIKNIITNKNKNSDNYGIYQFDLDDNNNEEEKKLKEDYFKKINEENLKFEKDVKKLNDEIAKMNKKYCNNSKPKEKKITNNININKKRNNSSYIGKRKYYNDNPYHYKYNYNGASIPIKKILKNNTDYENKFYY